MKKKVWSGILILVLLSGFFTIAIATYPKGALAALRDPWDAINQLFAKVAELEKRVGIIERLLGRVPNDTTVPNDTSEYPYSASLPPELIGKIEARYNYLKVYSLEWDEVEEKYKSKMLTDIRYEIQIKNLSNQTMTIVEYEVIVKDINGNILTSSPGRGYVGTLPGHRAVLGQDLWIKDALEKAGIDPTTDPELTVEIIITSIKFD